MAEIRIPVTVDLGNSEGKLKSIQNGITGTGESFVKLKTAIAAAKVGLDQALERFGPFSAQAAKAGKALGELNDRADKINKFSAAFDADAKFRAFSGAIQGGVGAFQGLAGAQALFGNESKATLEQIKKLQALLAFSQGINSVLEAKDSFIALGAQIKASSAFTSVYNGATRLATILQTAFGISVDATSTSFKVLRAAIISTGIGVLVVGLGLLISKMTELGDTEDNAAEKTKQLKDELDKLGEAFKNSQPEVNRQIQYIKNEEKIKDLQAAGGKNIKAINALRRQNLDITISSAKVELETKKGLLSLEDELTLKAKIYRAEQEKNRISIEEFAKGNEAANKIKEAELQKLEDLKKSIEDYKEGLRDISALQFDAGLINRFTRISDQIKLSEDQLKSLVTKFNLTSSDPLVKGLIKDIEKLKALIAPIPSLLDKIRQTEPITQLFDVKLKGKVEVPDISGAFKNVKEKTQAQIDDLNASLSSTLSSGLTSGISAVASAIGSAIATGANIWDAAGKALIGGLGDLMQQLGQDLIKANTLIELAKLSFGTGPAGILVGVALVALGAFLKSQFTEKAASGFADGGYVSGPGSSRSDSIPAMLSNGEYVINAASVNKYGIGFLNRINNGLGFADGGLVSRLMVNSSNISGGEIFGREVPYIASTQISGQDLKLILTRADKRFSNVT